jgi:hypothetical protein
LVSTDSPDADDPPEAEVSPGVDGPPEAEVSPGVDGPGGDGPAAASGQPGRYQRSPSGMVGALLVTLLVIGAFVALRACNRTDLDVKPQRVDYLAQIRDAQEAGATLVYPERLPSGWYATRVTISPGDPMGLELSMLTPASAYAGFVESPQPLSQLLSTYVDQHAERGASSTVPGSIVRHWDTWTDPEGDTALVSRRGHGATEETLLVFGTVPRAQLEHLAGSLTTAPLTD